MQACNHKTKAKKVHTQQKLDRSTFWVHRKSGTRKRQKRRFFCIPQSKVRILYLYWLLQQMLRTDQLTRRRHRHATTTSRHAAAHRLQAVEALGHGGRQEAVLGVRRRFLEGGEAVFGFALVVFFFAAVAAVRTFGAVAAVVGSAMSGLHGSVFGEVMDMWGYL